MNLRIDSFSASFSYHSDSFQSIVARLETEGYRPLIRKIAHELCAVVGGSLDELATTDAATEEADREISADINRRKLLVLEKLGYSWGLEGIRGLAKVPELKGELFLADDSENILFLTVLDTGTSKSKGRDSNSGPGIIRVGIIGANPDSVLLDLFKSDISSALQGSGNALLEWAQDNIVNTQFKECLAAQDESLHAFAASIDEREMKCSKALEISGVRDIANILRKSGVTLAKDLLRSKPETAADTAKCVDQLIQANLLHQEYVVICSKTGTHVNRVEHREIIDQMAKLGVLCSCGKRISEEAVEGLLAIDAALPRMLDKNYWMTVSVVRSLIALGIPPEKILLNPSVANDDVEILADLDGTLLMFNLKDAEYGIPHALSFTTRIGMHRPQMAFLVSTRGIAGDVKDHFKRVKLDTQMVYIANMLQLDATLKKVVEGVRMLRVKTWFDTFQSMMNFSLTPLLLQRLQTGKPENNANSADLAHQANSTESNNLRQEEIPVAQSLSHSGQSDRPSPQPEAVARTGQEALSPQSVQSTQSVQSAQSEMTMKASTESQPPERVNEPRPEITPQTTKTEPALSVLAQLSGGLHSMLGSSAVESPATSVPAEAPPADAPQASTDSQKAVAELEDLITEARGGIKPLPEIESVIPAAPLGFFAEQTAPKTNNDSQSATGANESILANPYKRVMKTLNPFQLSSPAPAPTVTGQDPLTAMDILDNVLEAVATSANPGDPGTNGSSIVNAVGNEGAAIPKTFSEQYASVHGNANQSQYPPINEVKNEEDGLPVAAF